MNQEMVEDGVPQEKVALGERLENVANDIAGNYIKKNIDLAGKSPEAMEDLRGKLWTIGKIVLAFGTGVAVTQETEAINLAVESVLNQSVGPAEILGTLKHLVVACAALYTTVFGYGLGQQSENLRELQYEQS